jgi:gas vesicle protein
MVSIEYLAFIISVISVLIAFWQGYLAKVQLEQAKTTKSETEKLLDEIKSKVLKIETISDETRKDIKDQVAKLVDKQDENFKVLLNAPKENNQNEMMMALLPKVLDNPEMMKTLLSLSNQQK